MASHHHSCYPPSPYTPCAPATPNPTPCLCHCCYGTYAGCHRNPPPPPDFHQHYHHPPPQPHIYAAQTDLLNSHQRLPRFGERYVVEERQAQPSISSLLRRIAALESALRRRSSSSFHCLREAAARTIQTHFRAFLVRRSRTVRQLMDLASIKSDLGILKASVSGRTHFNYAVVYHNAANLLVKLDAIQGGAPMIRDGKSSLVKELNKFLDSIDSVSVQSLELSCGLTGKYRRNNVRNKGVTAQRKNDNVKCGVLKKVNVEKLRGLAERIDKLAEELDEEENEVTESPNDCRIREDGVYGNRRGGLGRPHGVIQPKAKKTVTFAENGKVYRVLDEPFVDEDCDDSIDRDDMGDAERELEEDNCREVEEIGVSSKEAEDDDEEEAYSENEHSLSSSVAEKGSGTYTRMDGGRTRNFVVSAPIPVKMESRDGLIGHIKNRRT